VRIDGVAERVIVRVDQIERARRRATSALPRRRAVSIPRAESTMPPYSATVVPTARDARRNYAMHSRRIFTHVRRMPYVNLYTRDALDAAFDRVAFAEQLETLREHTDALGDVS
jgi:hypothetical protein